MGNVLSREKLEQVIALGGLGWSLRRIEQATGVRRETAGDYPRSAGIALRSPGGWGHGGPAKPAIRVTTDSEGAEAKPGHRGDHRLFLGKTSSKPDAEGSDSACQPYAELIAVELERGRNATGIWQLCRDRHSCQNAEFSTMPSRGYLARAFVLQKPIVVGILRGPPN
jgi:hypothetical protein